MKRCLCFSVDDSHKSSLSFSEKNNNRLLLLLLSLFLLLSVVVSLLFQCYDYNENVFRIDKVDIDGFSNSYSLCIL